MATPRLRQQFFFSAEPAPGQSPQELALELRDHLASALGGPVTVGIAGSKSLAKLVSDTAKPFGALALTDPDAELALLERLPVTEITGIAGRRAGELSSRLKGFCPVRARLTILKREAAHESPGAEWRRGCGRPVFQE